MLVNRGYKQPILSGTQDFFFVPQSWHADYHNFHIHLPSLKFTIYLNKIYIFNFVT